MAVVPGDGAGKEVIPEAVKVLRAVDADLEFEDFDIGADRYLQTGVALDDATFEQLKAADSILFGAVGDPRVDEHYAASILLRMRFEMDLWANLRPARLYDDRLSPLRDETLRRLDLLVVRENTEGIYIGAGGRFKKDTPDEVAIQEDVNTYKGVNRILEYAFTRARREVCMVDKSNAMGFAGGLWQSRWRAVAKAHEQVGSRHLYSDACCMELVRDPSQFDVIVTGNLFGDLLSDLSAQLIGGMGVAPSANLNPDTGKGLFEPVHGSAPRLAGRGIVNPLGAILTSSMMLNHLGMSEQAGAIEDAVVAAIRKRDCTVDLGGSLSTSEAGDAVVRNLANAGSR
ncbi:MAG: isocitrate/isopropylmalate dehydrogenase family protein [Candidatus Dormibacteraeota bacterium]|nr:isocitrate/isopropylmalate dehydrogenase family protein [Candidatus Dormibacteraeota bacterium]